MKKSLIDLVIARSFKFTEKPAFKLASGRKSCFYFNCKPVTLSPQGMFLIGNLLYRLIKKEKSWKVKAVGGLTLGADPVAAAVCYTSHVKKQPLEAFVVRKEPKKHGTMLWVEGHVKKGDRVIIVEDVITTGGSTIKAIKRARLGGLKVAGVVVLIDRQEGGKEAIEKMKVPVRTLLTKEEIFKVYTNLFSGK
ncbi:MAG TPA: orotate phosphoribosyltransferase [Nitrospirae bacterium]|nr:orotate phosphoribosyltransferase [Nitrospirota bacterium]HDK17715.1 orotate phosphoribosyltransferase [Nitrospirota bacterium]HDK81993.1 orotate phosphoribosyltransferase [Nitrospirota bacterium]HDO25543.1 orotate phosphoribosyltransferase [Nitrospirota bacterium]